MLSRAADSAVLLELTIMENYNLFTAKSNSLIRMCTTQKTGYCKVRQEHQKRKKGMGLSGNNDTG